MHAHIHNVKVVASIKLKMVFDLLLIAVSLDKFFFSIGNSAKRHLLESCGSMKGLKNSLEAGEGGGGWVGWGQLQTARLYPIHRDSALSPCFVLLLSKLTNRQTFQVSE